MGYLDEYLDQAHYTAKIERDEQLKQKYDSKFSEIKELLEAEYKGRIYTPFKSGSVGKWTAVNWSYDLDIVLPFKRSEAETLQEMYEEVAEFLEAQKAKDHTLFQVRRQTTSIGLLFQDGFEHLEIDVVPGRELKDEDFAEKETSKKKLNLYWNKDYPENRKSMLTNIAAQVEAIKGKGVERMVIRLLKSWKVNKGIKLKSFLLELITIRAFDKQAAKTGKWDNLKIALEFIRDNIATISLKDPGNSNNDVADTLTATEKADLKNQVKRILDDVEEDESRIERYFPINQKYKDEKAPMINSKPAKLGAAAILTSGATTLGTQRFA